MVMVFTDSVNKTAAVVGSGLENDNTFVSIPATASFQGVEYKITEVAANAFEGQTNLSYVSGMANVTKIGDRAFYNCSSLSGFSVDAYDRSGKNRLEIVGNEAFYNCSILSSVSLNCVSDIGYNAFAHCSELNYLYLQNLRIQISSGITWMHVFLFMM